MENLTSTAGLIRYLRSQREWLVTFEDRSFPITNEELEVSRIERGLRISFLAEEGLIQKDFERLKVVDEAIVLEGPFGLLRLIPRTAVLRLRESVEESRANEANRLADRLVDQFRGFKPLRVGLNEVNGRFAEITAQLKFSEVLVLYDVTGIVPAEALLTRALSWFGRASSQHRSRVNRVWVVVDESKAKQTEALVSCLRSSTSDVIRVLRYRRQAKKGEFFEEWETQGLETLWTLPMRHEDFESRDSVSKFSKRLVVRYENEIDVVTNRTGETVRYRGLPFARVREFKETTRIWFGLNDPRTLFEPRSEERFERLISDLDKYRSSDSPNKQHDFYRLSPEAWLESLLRKNVRRLDRNLILSPIYNQFRASREKVDLLALREDGRLVIIELKVNQDREMVFQAVDYWRRIERLRRNGSLDKAALFGKRKIRDLSAIVYLVAPRLGFHSDTELFAKMVRPEVEICRFDLAENWREEILVTRRRVINPTISADHDSIMTI